MKNLTPHPANQTIQQVTTSNHLDEVTGTNPESKEKTMPKDNLANLPIEPQPQTSESQAEQNAATPEEITTNNPTDETTGTNPESKEKRMPKDNLANLPIPLKPQINQSQSEHNAASPEEVVASKPTDETLGTNPKPQKKGMKRKKLATLPIDPQPEITEIQAAHNAASPEEVIASKPTDETTETSPDPQEITVSHSREITQAEADQLVQKINESYAYIMKNTKNHILFIDHNATDQAQKYDFISKQSFKDWFIDTKVLVAQTKKTPLGDYWRYDQKLWIGG